MRILNTRSACRLPRSVFRLPACAAAAAAMLAFAPPVRAAAQGLGIDIGKQAPGAIVQTLDGKAIDLKQALNRGPTVIEFWATWCPNCRELEPAVKAVAAKYAGKVHFVGVAVSVNESPERVRQYVAKHGIPGDQFFDAKGNATDAYDVPATSFVVVLDRSGKVAYTGVGGDQNLEQAIARGLRP